ncbi:hypothetical protein BT69DRAFT_1315119 [Atractiella rhizophila]|nr:hypothetical protein BT69DRAFT_1315119 [Atractiella rhizophila]
MLLAVLGGSAFVDCLFALFFMLAFKKHLRSTNFSVGLLQPMSVRADITSGNNRPDIACVGSANIPEAVNPIWRRSQPAHINPSNPRTHPLPSFIRYGLSFCSSLLAVITQARAWSSSSHDNGSIGTPNYRIQHNAPDFETEVAHQTSTEPNFVEMALRVQTGRKFATETQA